MSKPGWLFVVEGRKRRVIDARRDRAGADAILLGYEKFQPELGPYRVIPYQEVRAQQ